MFLMVIIAYRENIFGENPSRHCLTKVQATIGFHFLQFFSLEFPVL